MNGLKEWFDLNLPNAIVYEQKTHDQIPTFWIEKEQIKDVLNLAKNKLPDSFEMLYDLTAIDERNRENRKHQPKSKFTLVYHLLSFKRNKDLRLKVALDEDYPSIQSICDIYQNANWYEREVYDLFGINFLGHPFLKRILMPSFWKGHPLRKEHPARATELPPFSLSDDQMDEMQDLLQINPENFGFSKSYEGVKSLFLNLGPQHPGTHGVLRVILQMHGEEIIDSALDIGYHHRGAEKMAERQTWHSYIPYTDRIDYLGGVINNLAYLLAIEQLAQIEIPKRAQYIRVMLCELFRIASHLVWFGTFAADVGSLSPVFYTFSIREKIFDIVTAITGGRMHPSWFRIGGVAADLPLGYEPLLREFIKEFPKSIKDFKILILENSIFKARTVGVGAYTKQDAIDFGVTGAGLRACGVDFDFRKARSYCSYEDFLFDIPTATNGDCYDRALVRVEEMLQSLRIVEQSLDKMPKGEYKSDHPLTTPPRKDKTLVDIETLIHHFINETYGPLMPVGESFFGIEASKGNNGYYVISDGKPRSYRTRIRTPSFAHLQMLPKLSKGGSIADLMAILGSIDYVLADLDR